MQTYSNAIADAVAGNGKGPLTPETINKLRKVQSEALDGRWNAMLENLRRRTPFANLPVLEQRRAFLRLAQLRRMSPRRKSGSTPPPAPAMPSCAGGFREVATLGSGPFAFGSADTPQVVPANDQYSPGDGSPYRTTVQVTFPHTGQIGLGAAVGGPAGTLWEPTQSVWGFQGNRASAFLSQGFYIPDLATIASGALTVACSVSLPSPCFALVAGVPSNGDPLTTLVSVCGQATLDVVACNLIDDKLHLNGPSQSASQTQQLFNASGIGNQDNDSFNIFGENWDTTISGLGPNGTVPTTDLTASIGVPLATANYLLVTISVEVSAWTEPSTDSMAFVDVTGQNTGLPIFGTTLLYPGYYANSEANTQPIQISGLRVCGISQTPESR